MCKMDRRHPEMGMSAVGHMRPTPAIHTLFTESAYSPFQIRFSGS